MAKKSIRLFFIIIMITISLSCISACNKKHEHTYKDGWVCDETYHWRIATCGDIEIGLKSKHNFIDDKCTLCGYDKDGPDEPKDPETPDNPGTDNPNDPETEDPNKPNKPNRPDPNQPSDDPEDPDSPDDPYDPNDPDGEQDYPEQGSDGLTYTLTFDQEKNGYAVSAGSNKSASNIEIPDTYKNLPVVKIDDRGFAGCSLSSITIPNSVTAIGFAAFSNCKSLTSITIPDSVTSIEMQAFEECSALREIELSKNLTTIYYKTFYNCRLLQKIDIPDNVTSIGRYVFYGCSSLSEISVGKSVKSFGDMNFIMCNSLKRVNITDLDAWCRISFIGALSNPLYVAHYMYLNGQPVKEVTFPDDLEDVSNCVFIGCYSIEKVTFSDNMKSIGFDAFDGCQNLKQVDFGSCGIKSFADQIFLGCTSLTSIVLPDSLEDIGRGLFDGCRKLNNVVLGKNIKTIGMYTFKDCDALNSINYKGSEEEWKKIWIHATWTGESQRKLEVIYNYNGGK